MNSEFLKRVAEQNQRQDYVNTNLFNKWSTLFVIDNLHSQYPQYKNHFDDWQMVTVTQDVTTKAGQAFKAGDKTLGWKQELWNNDWYWHVFSFRNNVTTRLKYHVEKV